MVGAGAAGLTAAYELTRLGERPLVLEAGPRSGGLARTECFRGFHFDMGGHRFFTKSRLVRDLWREVLGQDLLRRPRLSRIRYGGRFIPYPLRLWPTLGALGGREAACILFSWAAAQMRSRRGETSFEDWVTNRFGQRLYRTFFRSYTEKVWGLPCSEIKAEWAAQRLKDLSIPALLMRALRLGGRGIRTLAEEFDYPRLGPGMMWSAIQDAVERRGGRVLCGVSVRRVRRRGARIEALDVVEDGVDGTVEGEQFISSMPITELVRRLHPAPPPAVLEAAQGLRYRAFLTVCLIVDRAQLFADNWIYVHDPLVRVARIQNFKNWSPAMVPDTRYTSLGLEYFCDEGDSLWTRPDLELIELGRRELDGLGLARAAEVVDGCVFRVPKAYPVYDASFAPRLALLREHVAGLENLQTVGRNGLHRYNNQDHSMLTGVLAARNAALGERNDVWSVNSDGEYLEELRAEDAERDQAEAPTQGPERRPSLAFADPPADSGVA